MALHLTVISMTHFEFIFARVLIHSLSRPHCKELLSFIKIPSAWLDHGPFCGQPGLPSWAHVTKHCTAGVSAAASWHPPAYLVPTGSWGKGCVPRDPACPALAGAGSSRCGRLTVIIPDLQVLVRQALNADSSPAPPRPGRNCSCGAAAQAARKSGCALTSEIQGYAALTVNEHCACTE